MQFYDRILQQNDSGPASYADSRDNRDVLTSLDFTALIGGFMSTNMCVFSIV